MGWGTSFGRDPLHALTLCLSYCYVTPRVTPFAQTHPIKSYNDEHGTAIIIRQVKYLNNMVEQDQRGVKRVTRPMLGFKSFEAAQDTLVGIELMHMIKKRQLVVEAGDENLTAAELFYSLAA
jgi:transposase-like protein